MNDLTTNTPFKVAGVLIRTTNERAFEDIPALWKAFFQADVVGRIVNRASDDLFAVYTEFEHEGVDNLGTYSFLIGAMVPRAFEQVGIVTVDVPASRRALFPVKSGRPEQVGTAWREIWARDDLQKTFVCDYERYQPDGTIVIHVGIR